MRKIVDVSDKIQQEWVRPIDAAAACGLGTSRLYELLSEARGQIRSCAWKSPGAKKGARLINLPSLLSYFEQMAEQYANLTNCTENSGANNEKPEAFLNGETVQGSECLRAWRYSSGAPSLRILQADNALSDSESPEASRWYRPTQRDAADERLRLSKEKGGMQA